VSEPQRIDLHTHTLWSDGVLLPSELLRRAVVRGHRAVALTDHADATNLKALLDAYWQLLREQPDDFPLTFIPGVELTHVAPRSVAKLAEQAKALGAGLVVVHGETSVEPVAPGTNLAAAQCPQVDLLAHPGLITLEAAQAAARHDIYLEITSRQGHCLTNGHVARIAREAGARLVVNTDAHSPSDLIDQELARAVARGAGLTPEEVEAATVTNPLALVERAQRRVG